jgi:uncharacterized protein
MAVVTLYQSDRDLSKTFTDKKDADVYDKMLELAENVGSWMLRNVPDLSDDQSQQLGTLVAQNKAMLIKAFKGKAALLLETTTEDDTDSEPQSEEATTSTEAEANDTAIASND